MMLLHTLSKHYYSTKKLSKSLVVKSD